MTWLNGSKTPVVLLGACVAIALSVSACTGEPEKTPMSEAELGWDPGQSVVESPDDVVAMSGEYQVTREGKLLRYPADPRLDKPELGDVAKVHDSNGAEAFGEYFIKVVEYTWDSGDTTLLREISLPSCEWCEYMASTTDERRSNKGWVRNLRSNISEIETAFEIPTHPGLWHVVVHVKNSDHVMYDGHVIRDVVGAAAILNVQMRYENGVWKVHEAIGEDDSQ